LLLFYRKQGFLKTNVIYQVKSDQGKIFVDYLIQEGDQSTFTAKDSILVDNPQLASSMQTYLKTSSLIKPNSPLSVESINEQKTSIVNYFRNKGYFYFNPEVVGIHINDLKDSTLKDISLIYKIPSFTYSAIESRKYDRVYRFDKLKINETAINQKDETSTWIKRTINSNQLKRIINIKEGDIYSLDKVNQSLLNIYATDQFKTVNVNFDTTANKVSPTIDLVKNNKYTFSSELGGSVFRGIPGPFLTNSFKIRSVFSYLDYLDFTGRIGFEAQTGFINTETTRKNLEVNLSTTLNLPSLYIPRNLDRWKQSLTASQTQIGIGYDYIDRPEYIRTNVKVFQRYNWKKSTNKFFNYHWSI